MLSSFSMYLCGKLKPLYTFAPMQKRLIIFGAFSGAIAVALGAMGAHALKAKVADGILTVDNVQAFETAVKYQMYHSILIILLALLINKVNNKLLSKSAYAIMIGIVLFSGSIYILSTSSLLGLNNLRFLGPITPIGGVFLIIGWVLLAVSAASKKQNP